MNYICFTLTLIKHKNYFILSSISVLKLSDVWFLLVSMTIE